MWTGSRCSLPVLAHSRYGDYWVMTIWGPSMPKSKITKSAVDGLTAAGRPQFLWDPELKGFGVKAEASGSKSYVIQYRIGGRGSPPLRHRACSAEEEP